MKGYFEALVVEDGTFVAASTNKVVVMLVKMIGELELTIGKAGGNADIQE